MWFGMTASETQHLWSQTFVNLSTCQMFEFVFACLALSLFFLLESRLCGCNIMPQRIDSHNSHTLQSIKIWKNQRACSKNSYKYCLFTCFSFHSWLDVPSANLVFLLTDREGVIPSPSHALLDSHSHNFDFCGPELSIVLQWHQVCKLRETPAESPSCSTVHCICSFNCDWEKES